MGGQSGGGGSTPYEAPNTLSSAQSLRIIDAISEGVVSGFANGDSAPFKSVFLDDTPVQNADNSYNFKGIVGFFQRGTQDQTYVPGFDASERTVPVSTSVKKATPVVRAVSDDLVNRLRVTVGVDRNVRVKDNGDSVAATTQLRIELVGNSGVVAAKTVTFKEKGSGAYYQDVLFNKLPPVPFNIRVVRVTADSTTDKISNNTFFASYVEIIDAKLSYPHTAFAALAIDSDQFGNNVPRRNYLLKGRLVKVPSNYDPETRTYSGGTWDGSFKTAWTNNPAWVFYDVLTQARFSTLARRLKLADVDKWALYQVAKYCDELVDDGFGGKEPRFVCNAYITDVTQAGEFLTNLASVFTGLPLWNGNQVSVVMDADADPVALYNNSNVKDGLFTYSGAAYKSIHTAVHVQYVDKNDSYRTKTEYVADNDAIARYGLNIKQITAFGCDSRGQAARFGAWVLQTELRQQNMVSFEVGRDGLKHLPYDIVQVMDNHYAGAELSGRVQAVDGTTVTLDRDVIDSVGALFYYSDADGLKSTKVVQQPAANQVVLESAVGVSVQTGWALSGKVKPRLYRAIGIKENTEEGTYTISALLHDPKKYAAVDKWASFDREITTLHNVEPVLINGDLATDGNAVVLSWDNLTASGQVLTYDIKIYRNGQLYRHTPDAQTAEIRLENLPNGDYKAEIRGRNARGVLSEPLVKAWSINYSVTGLRAIPKTFAIGLDWVLPQTVVSSLTSEVWYSQTNDIQTATKLVSLPYPQNHYTLTGVGISDVFYFWVRIVDAAGNAGEFTAAVQGQADNNPAPIVQQIQGAITKSALSQSLIESLNSDMSATAQTETAKEAAIRAAEIRATANKAASDLTAKASEIGTRVSAVETVNNQQAQQISTVTAAQGQTAAGLEAEKKARADGDAAEASARQTLASRVASAESDITQEVLARTAADNAQVAETNALKGRVGNAESSITDLRESKADASQVAAIARTALQAEWRGYADSLNNVEYVNNSVNLDERNPSWYAAKARGDYKMLADAGRLGIGNFGWVTVITTNAYGTSAHVTQRAVSSNSGLVWQRVGVDGTTWGGWTRQETVAGAAEKAEAAKNAAIAEAQRLSIVTDSRITALQQTVAEKDRATASQLNALTASLNNIGGVNLLVDSEYTSPLAWSGAAALSSSVFRGRRLIRIGVKTDGVAQIGTVQVVGGGKTKLVAGVEYTLSMNIQGTAGFQATGMNYVYLMRDSAEGVNHRLDRIPITASLGNRVKLTFTAPFTSNTVRLLIAANGTFASSDWFAFHSVKLERGGVATDWSATPEDLDVAVSAVDASLTDYKAAQAAKDQATVTQLSGLTARVGSAESSISQNSSAIATVDGKVQSMYTLKVETISGGRKVASGLALGADGQTGDSQILLYADKLALVNPSSKAISPPFVVTTKAGGGAQMALDGDFIATDSILARHIAANQKITTPILDAPTINAGRLNSTTINNGNGAFTVNEAGDLYARNGRFEGVIRADKIEGFLVEQITVRRGEITYRYGTTSDYRCSYVFEKVDARAAYAAIETIESFATASGSNAITTNTYVRLYLDDVLVRPRRVYESLDGVDSSNATAGHPKTGVVPLPVFKVGTGSHTIRVEVYGWRQGVGITANVPDFLTITFNYN
ncbi:phage tail protein [Neisseria arctica]|uniref:phage tail protein n=1 Tax=Neisseria arctica TaxID=1470200 RepID=UPI0009E363DD|nr:phage tail protein [Neisseria arctica]UOO87507.1 phage tail protein [Neisseria arctica]